MMAIPLSGKDSAATVLIQTAYEPGEYTIFFVDTGCELPETYAWLDDFERKTGLTIHRIGADLEQIIKEQGILPAPKTRFCTRLSKIRPMEHWLGDGHHTVYFGIRADERRIGYEQRSKKCIITPRYPLQDHGIGLGQVYAILQAKNLLPPAFHWQALEDCIDSLWSNIFGDWRTFIGYHEKRILLAGRSRNNCYFCFYQRMYEFCWLADTHPDLLARAIELECTVGGENYTWREKPLKQIISEKNKWIERRAREVIKYIESRIYNQITYIAADTELSTTSCGFLCGK